MGRWTAPGPAARRTPAAGWRPGRRGGGSARPGSTPPGAGRAPWRRRWTSPEPTSAASGWGNGGQEIVRDGIGALGALPADDQHREGQVAAESDGPRVRVDLTLVVGELGGAGLRVGRADITQHGGGALGDHRSH